MLDARDAPTAVALGGGVSASVVAVSWPRGRAVVKRALPKLRVAADWPFDPSRSLVERDALAYLTTILPAGTVPAVLASDEDEFVLVMEHAPDGGVVWKDELLGGAVDPDVGARVGALLGTVHRASATDADVRRRFADPKPLIEGRVDPFHRFVAERHPDLAPVITAEVERLLATRRALVLGDVSPKNILVYPDRVMLLDHETAHWGDPAFDVAFLLTHLVLKAHVVAGADRPLRASAGAFWAAYSAAAGVHSADQAAVVAELGCVLLARVDGKSPATYLEARHKEQIRLLARELLLGGAESIDSMLDRAMRP
jgi:5-methylthioribose kinase